MATDADEATNALIARMLAEDDAYEVDAYGLGPEGSSEDEWDAYGRRKKARKKAKKGQGTRQKRERPAVPDDPNQEYTESGRRKRKDAGKKMRAKPRAWTAEEERLFREALKLYGRDWKQCAAHVKTRDAKAFTSHAQKYFIKMCLQGKPLPRKVAESGEGYTLSGKPLDPHSAAARAYGFKPDTLEKLKAEGLAHEAPEGGGLTCAAVTDAGAGEGEEEEIPLETFKSNNKENMERVNGSLDAKDAKKKKPKAGRPPKALKSKKQEDLLPAEPAEPTEYAKNRPRRENAGKSAAKSDFVSAMSGSLRLIPCRDFTGIQGCKSAQAQPFGVEISDEAMVLMDFHAHLSCFEVIGYLGGDWDPESRKLTIRRAFPCKGLAGTQQTDSCEMDPESELAAKQKMDEWGLQVVGWYHSHPTFKPNPSQKDIENQENYQALFHDEEAKAEPFVGMIFSPYDVRLPTRESRREIFWVGKEKSSPEGSTPMHMRSTRRAVAGIVTEDTKATMREVVASVQGRVDLTELWRPFTRLEGAVPSGGPVTKLAKMRGALGAYLPESDEAEDFLDEIFTTIQKSWGVDLGY